MTLTEPTPLTGTVDPTETAALTDTNSLTVPGDSLPFPATLCRARRVSRCPRARNPTLVRCGNPLPM